jgi:hypothetical protein
VQTFFGTRRETRSRAQLASSEYALVTIGRRSELGQSVQGSYTRQIQTIFEIGTPTVTWLAGHESGQLNFQRLVGKNGFFDGWQGDECGVITPVAIGLGGGPCVAAASGGLRFDGAMIESLNWTLSAGTLEITEGVALRVASMSRA